MHKARIRTDLLVPLLLALLTSLPASNGEPADFAGTTDADPAQWMQRNDQIWCWDEDGDERPFYHFGSTGGQAARVDLWAEHPGADGLLLGEELALIASWQNHLTGPHRALTLLHEGGHGPGSSGASVVEGEGGHPCGILIPTDATQDQPRTVHMGVWFSAAGVNGFGSDAPHRIDVQASLMAWNVTVNTIPDSTYTLEYGDRWRAYLDGDSGVDASSSRYRYDTTITLGGGHPATWADRETGRCMQAQAGPWQDTHAQWTPAGAASGPGHENAESGRQAAHEQVGHLPTQVDPQVAPVPWQDLPTEAPGPVALPTGDVWPLGSPLYHPAGLHDDATIAASQSCQYLFGAAQQTPAPTVPVPPPLPGEPAPEPTPPGPVPLEPTLPRP